MTEYWPKHLLVVPLAAIPHPTFTIATNFDAPTQDIERLQRCRRTGEFGEWINPATPDVVIRLEGSTEMVAYILYVALAEFKSYCDGQCTSLERPIRLLEDSKARYGNAAMSIRGCVKPKLVDEMLHAMRAEQSISDWFRWWYAHDDEEQRDPWGRKPHQLMDQPCVSSLFQEARERLARASTAAQTSVAASSEPLKKLMVEMKLMTDMAARMHKHYNESLQRSNSMETTASRLKGAIESKRALFEAFDEEHTFRATLAHLLKIPYFFKTTPPIPKWLATYARFIEQAITVS